MEGARGQHTSTCQSRWRAFGDDKSRNVYGQLFHNHISTSDNVQQEQEIVSANDLKEKGKICNSKEGELLYCTKDEESRRNGFEDLFYVVYRLLHE